MKRLLALLLLVTVILSCGCTAGYLDKTEGDSIPPVQDSSISTASTIMPLYFRYYNEPMLVRYSLNVEITNHEEPEFYALSALMSETFGERPEITYCFKGNTKLVSVESDGQYLYVTLSDGFYTDTKGATEEETLKNRYIAIYSIVNTVCEMGNHSWVQLYIEQNGTALRPDSYLVGIAKSKEESTPLGPLSRNTELILTPSNVAQAALDHYSKTQWSKLYLYLAGDSLPLVEEVAEDFDYLNLIMTEFSVEDNYTVSDDYKTATVQVSFKIRSKNTSYEVENVPLELVYRSRTWFVLYESLLKHLGVAN